nr:hypothetical protein [uncultured Leptotrichia sp.]
MGKNSGEMLVESLISMFFIVSVLFPIANIFLKTFRINVKSDNEKNSNLQSENMLELLKNIDYLRIFNFQGKYDIKGMKEFYSRFTIDDKYRILGNDLFEKNKKVKISSTEYYYVNENNEKEYIFEIEVDGIKRYYFPKIL